MGPTDAPHDLLAHLRAGGPPAVVLRSSIWRCDGDAWRLAFHQGTPAG